MRWQGSGLMCRSPWPPSQKCIIKYFILPWDALGKQWPLLSFGPSPASTVDPYSVHGSHFLLSVRFTLDKTDRMPGLKQLIDKGIYIFLMTENPAAGLALNTAWTVAREMSSRCDFSLHHGCLHTCPKWVRDYHRLHTLSAPFPQGGAKRFSRNSQWHHMVTLLVGVAFVMCRGTAKTCFILILHFINKISFFCAERCCQEIDFIARAVDLFVSY